jgi:hypothetical protein
LSSTPPLRLDLAVLILTVLLALVTSVNPVTLFVLINLMSANTAVFNVIVNLRVMIYKSSAFKPGH